MKTAEQWYAELEARPCVTKNDLIVAIKLIQEDARRDAVSFLDQALNEGVGTYKP